MVTMTAAAVELDLAATSVREVNRALRALPAGSSVRLRSARGQHNLAVGLDAAIDVDIDIWQLVPATSAELAWCRVRGSGALRERWADAEVDLIDLARPGVGLAG